VEALRKAGAYVALVNQAGLPDLFVLYRERWYALEVKTGKGRSQPCQRAQKRFLELTGTPVVRTPQAALKAIGSTVELPVLQPLELKPPPASLAQEYPRR